MDLSYRQADYEHYISQEDEVRNAYDLSYIIGYYPDRGEGFINTFGQIEIALQNLSLFPDPDSSIINRNLVIRDIGEVLGSLTGDLEMRKSPVSMDWWQTEKWDKPNPLPAIFSISDQIEKGIPLIIDGTTAVFKSMSHGAGEKYTIKAKLKKPKEVDDDLSQETNG